MTCGCQSAGTQNDDKAEQRQVVHDVYITFPGPPGSQKPLKKGAAVIKGIRPHQSLFQTSPGLPFDSGYPWQPSWIAQSPTLPPWLYGFVSGLVFVSSICGWSDGSWGFLPSYPLACCYVQLAGLSFFFFSLARCHPLFIRLVGGLFSPRVSCPPAFSRSGTVDGGRWMVAAR